MTIGVPESATAEEGEGVRAFAVNLSLEGLVRTQQDGRPAPWLAESWNWATDFRELRIQLRPNIFLHDGRRLDAGLATELLKPSISAAGNRNFYPTLNDIASIRAEGDRDIVIALSRPSPLLLGDLTMQLRTGADGLVGTGPFRVVSSSPSELTLSRFDDYYQGTPTIQTVVVKPFDTLRTAWASLLRGEVDVVSDVPPEAIGFVRNDDVQVVLYPRRYQRMLAFNSQKGALRVPAVRRALNMAVDRASVVARVLGENGTVATGALWPKFWAYDESVPPIPFDPAQAARLLDEAGYPVQPSRDAGAAPSRFRFVCLIPRDFSVFERIALELQQYLLTVGVDMQLRAVALDEFNSLIRTGNFDAVLTDLSLGPSPARPYAFWRSRRAHEGSNFFGYENPEAERLFTTLLSTATNEVAGRSATRRLQEVLLDDPPALYIAWTTRSRAIRRSFSVPDEGGDPLVTLWQWKPNP